MNLPKSFRLTRLHADAQSHSQVAVPRQFPTTGFEAIPASEKVKEECWDWYTPQSFYPVRIGDVIHSRYQVLYKAGYGTTSTLRICRDLHASDYVCMKSMVCNYPSVQREVKAYKAISKAAETTTMRGKNFVRKALDHFEVKIEDRNYPFLIHKPLGLTVEMVVAFSVLDETEEDEIEHPSRRKVTKQTAVFESRGFMPPLRRWMASNDPFVLCNFGKARTGKDSYTGLIQPALFRAPEVFLCIPWGTLVDVWNLGCMVWNLMFNNHLFSQGSSSGKDGDGQTACRNQLARMVAFLGPPPRELLNQSGSVALEFFYEDGTPKGEVPNETLESFLESSMKKTGRTMIPKDLEMFLAFLRKTLTWTQEMRASAIQLLSDPWILK
ncbi:hypothetical protein C0993_003729 [Termitomyces sp. T159_Od127]|nr:hypothetical protein C0993_003729 [Termitomyces sp. T159_Od127]